MKKYLKYFILIAFFVGMFFTQWNLVALIDIVVVRPIVNVLFLIYNVIGDFGSAIILFTILVKLLMYPLTKKQLFQTRLMKKIQPELVEIRKNSNGNKQLESLQTMDLYKKYNIHPFRSILTIFIQLPIFIALFSAIRIMVVPTPDANLENRAYSFVAYEGSKISEVIELQRPYLADKTDDSIPNEDKTAYDFHPVLFGLIPLDGYASGVLSLNFSLANLFALGCALVATLVQYIVTKQQQPTNKKHRFRDLMADAKAGKDIDQSALSDLSTSQMNIMMPLMMFIIMFSLPGALVFYYFLSNLLSMALNKFILHRAERTMDDNVDRAMTRELKHIQEAQIIENKKTGTKTKVTHISET